jgi:hypothetical protein
MEAAVTAQYAVDRWSPRLLASESGHEAYTHVATRNGLSLQPVGALNLDAAPEARTADGDAVPEVTTTSSVQTTEDIATTEDVATTAEVDAPAEDTTIPDPDVAQDPVIPGEPDEPEE